MGGLLTGLVTLLLVLYSAAGHFSPLAGFVAFLWPTAAPVFGGKVNVGKLDDILSSIRSNGGFYYSSSARSYITQYPSEALPKAKGKLFGPKTQTGPIGPKQARMLFVWSITGWRQTPLRAAAAA